MVGSTTPQAIIMTKMALTQWADFTMKKDIIKARAINLNTSTKQSLLQGNK
jgi:hypothetical protein